METTNLSKVVFDADWARDFTPAIKSETESSQENDSESKPILDDRNSDTIYISEQSKDVSDFFTKFWNS